MPNILDMTLVSVNKEIANVEEKLRVMRRSKVLSIYSTIDRRLVDWLKNALENLQKEEPITKLDIILESAGGDPDAAYHMANMLNEVVVGELNFIVPRMAKSAATLMACGGNSIIMSESSELGPIDPQIRRVDGNWISALSVKASLKLLQREFKEGNSETATILAHKLNALDLGEIERTLEISKKYVKDLLATRMFDENLQNDKIEKIADQLTTGYTHHSYIINYKEAKDKLGLKVIKPSDDEWKLIQEHYFRFNQLAEIQSIAQSLNEYRMLNSLISKRLIKVN